MIDIRRRLAKAFAAVMLFLCCALPFFTQGMQTSAAVAEDELIHENFHGSDIEYYDWRYQENVGIEVVKESSVLQILEPLNGTGITSVAEYGQEGIVAELDFGYLSLASTGFFGIIFGAGIAGDNVSALNYVLSGAQEEPFTFLYFILTQEVLALVVYNTLSTDLNILDQNGDELRFSAGVYYFDDFTPADAGSGVALRDQTLRVCYGKDGSLAISVRASGVDSEEQVLGTLSGGKLPAVNGHVSLVTMEPGVNLEIRKVHISDETGSSQSIFDEETDSLTGNFTSFVYTGTKNFYAGPDNFVRFSPESANDSTLIFRQGIQASENVPENVLSLSFTMRAAQIVGDKRFEVRFGLKQLSAISDCPDSYAVYFCNLDGELGYGMDYLAQPDGYKHGTNVVKISPKKLPVSFGDEIEIRAEQDYNGFFRLYCNGLLLDSVYGLPKPGGYVGFMQSGSDTDADNFIDVSIDDVSITNRYDNCPANTNIDLDFESGELNLNEWQISSNASYGRTGGVYVADGVLRFDNVGNDSKMVTKHRYANFEMSFDIVDVRREVVRDSFGNKIYPVSSVFGVMFGIETYAATFMGMYMQSPILSFQTGVDPDTWEKTSGTSVTLYGSDANDPGTVLPDKYDFFDKANDGKIVNVSLSLIDSHFVLKLKYSDESQWYTVYDKNFETTYVGYIAVWGMGAGSENDLFSCGQFTLDNLKITNKDSTPNLADVPYLSNRPSAPGDYVYVDRNDDEEYLIEDMKIPKEGA